MNRRLFFGALGTALAVPAAPRRVYSFLWDNPLVVSASDIGFRDWDAMHFSGGGVCRVEVQDSDGNRALLTLGPDAPVMIPKACRVLRAEVVPMLTPVKGGTRTKAGVKTLPVKGGTHIKAGDYLAVMSTNEVMIWQSMDTTEPNS